MELVARSPRVAKCAVVGLILASLAGCASLESRYADIDAQYAAQWKAYSCAVTEVREKSVCSVCGDYVTNTREVCNMFRNQRATAKQRAFDSENNRVVGGGTPFSFVYIMNQK
jgi:hypothetical protein